MPLRKARINIYDYDIIVGDFFLGGYITDESGFFTTPQLTSGDFNGPDLYIQVITEGAYCDVRNPSGRFAYTSSVISDWKGGECPINLDITDTNFPTTVGASRILDAVYEAGSWFNDVWLNSPPSIDVFWVQGFWPKYSDGPVYDTASKEIYLSGIGGLGNGNADFPDMVIHEYGHYVSDYLMDWTLPYALELDPINGIDYNYAPDLFDNDNINIAFVEGFAYYFSSRANQNDKMIDSDSNYTFYSAGLGKYIYFDFEYGDSNSPSENLPINTGIDVIGNVAMLFLDMVDDTPEEPIFLNGVEVKDISHIPDFEIFNTMRPDIYPSSQFRSLNDFFNEWSDIHESDYNILHSSKIPIYINNLDPYLDYWWITNNIMEPTITLDFPEWGKDPIILTADVDDDDIVDKQYQTITYQYSKDYGSTWNTFFIDSYVFNGISTISWDTGGLNHNNVAIRVKTYDDIMESVWEHKTMGIDNTNPSIPVISSSTHIENIDSNNNDPTFSWTEISDLSGITYYYEWNHMSSTVPTFGSPTTTGLSKLYINQADSIWYFHVR
ncbi:MAG: hypothetical protein KAJ19_10370, partial [Gammaproteobacteria bacterium]|nr:hypothetical protein [Gammaproteobacteria bacterium]